MIEVGKTKDIMNCFVPRGELKSKNSVYTCLGTKVEGMTLILTISNKEQAELRDKKQTYSLYLPFFLQ